MSKNMQIMLDYCYDFLCSDSSDSIELVRKNYTYHLSYTKKYNYTIYQYFYDYEGDTDEYSFRKSQEREDRKRRIMIRLVHDSYLAILLHRMNPEIYSPIIVGLCSYFECSDYKITPPLKEIMANDQVEYFLTKEGYINKLKTIQHPSTNVGDYEITPSLGSIIKIENEMIDSDAMVKCLYKKQEIPYGSLKL